jgi:hypothetical protein
MCGLALGVKQRWAICSLFITIAVPYLAPELMIASSGGL